MRLSSLARFGRRSPWAGRRVHGRTYRPPASRTYSPDMRVPVRRTVNVASSTSTLIVIGVTLGRVKASSSPGG